MKLINKELFTIYALATISIIGLTYFVQTYPISGFDLFMTIEIQEQRGWDLTFIMKFISIFYNLWIGPLTVIITSLLFWITRHKKEAVFTFAVIIPDLSNLLMKIAIHRARPTPEDAKILSTFTQSSFPSGHVVHYVVFFGFLIAAMIINKNISLFWRLSVSLVSAFLILTVSISRIYLGAHWATDVLGGYLFGLIYLMLLLRYYLV